MIICQMINRLTSGGGGLKIVQPPKLSKLENRVKVTPLMRVEIFLLSVRAANAAVNGPH